MSSRQVRYIGVQGVVAFDPGNTIGIATWIDGTVRMSQVKVDYSMMERGIPLEACEDIAVAQIIARMEEVVRRGYRITDVVAEDFQLLRSEMSKDLLSPVRVNQSLISGIRRSSVLNEEGLVRWHFQQPSERKGIPVVRLQRSLGLRNATAEGEMRHATDAARHLMLFLRKQGVWRG